MNNDMKNAIFCQLITEENCKKMKNVNRTQVCHMEEITKKKKLK